MAVATAVDFRSEVKRLFELFDRMRHDELKAMFADDAQGVDEISRAWIRGKDSMDKYFRKLKELGVGDIKSSISDLQVKQWGDVALVTGIADQTYSMSGDQVVVKAPMSVLFRKTGGDWRIALVHAVPLPESS